MVALSGKNLLSDWDCSGLIEHIANDMNGGLSDGSPRKHP